MILDMICDHFKLDPDTELRRDLDKFRIIFNGDLRNWDLDQLVHHCSLRCHCGCCSLSELRAVAARMYHKLSSDANRQSLQFRGGFAVSTLAVGSCDSLSQPQRCAQFVHSIWSQGTCFHQLKDSIQGHKPCQYSFEQVYLIGKTTLGKSQIYPKEIGQVLLTT